MLSEREKAARGAVEPLINKVLKDGIREIVASGQEQEAADLVVKAIWPVLKPEDVVRLDACDEDFLRRSNHIPPTIVADAVALLQREIPKNVESLGATNPYLKGKDLAKIVKRFVEARADAVRAAADALFERNGTDRFALLKNIQSRVVADLSNLCREELKNLTTSSDEEEAKRHLKILTALTNPGGDPRQREELLRQITDGKTASFPYVLKYLIAGKVPEQASLPSKGPPSLTGFTPELENLVPEASPVKAALSGYLHHNGVLAKFLDESLPLAPEHAEIFSRAPEEFEMPGGLYLPKQAHLETHRKERYRLPDGIVCAVGVTTVLESLLRQAQTVLGLAGGTNARPRDMLRRLGSVVALSQETLAHLEIVFDPEQIALRDAVAHGVFVANDETLIEEILGGLTKTLDLLLKDLTASGHLTAITAAPHWSIGQQLEAAHEASFEKQFAGNLNLFRQPRIEELRRHTFKVLTRLAPDKSLLGRNAILIWADLDGTTPGKLAGNPAAEFVGIVSALIALEELFRAVQEIYGERVLRVSRDSDERIKCELSILDDQNGCLLEPAKMAKVFASQWTDAEFQESVAAVKALRDTVLHGGWGCLTLRKVRYLHLIVKLIITLSTTVSFDTSGSPQKG